MSDLLRAADMVRAASRGEAVGLCYAHGHDEVLGWEDPADGALYERLPDVAFNGERRDDPSALSPYGHTLRAVTFCKRCRRVWR